MNNLQALLDAAKASSEKIAETRYLIEGLRHEIRIINSTIDNPNAHERMVAGLDATIAKLQKQRARAVERFERGYELIAHYRERVATLEMELVAMTSSEKITRLIRLAEQINNLAGEIPPEVLAANLANDEGDE